MNDNWITTRTTADDRENYTKKMLSEMQERHPNFARGALTKAVDDTWEVGITLSTWEAKVESDLSMKQRIDSARGSHKEPDDLRRAKMILEELVRHVRPPNDWPIVLTERKSSGETDPNWVAGYKQTSDRFTEKIAELRKTDPQIDWSDIKTSNGSRSIALKLSEVEPL